MHFAIRIWWLGKMEIASSRRAVLPLSSSSSRDEKKSILELDWGFRISGLEALLQCDLPRAHGKNNLVYAYFPFFEITSLRNEHIQKRCFQSLKMFAHANIEQVLQCQIFFLKIQGFSAWMYLLWFCSIQKPVSEIACICIWSGNVEPLVFFPRMLILEKSLTTRLSYMNWKLTSGLSSLCVALTQYIYVN